MTEKWVGIYTPKILFPYGEFNLECCRKTTELIEKNPDYEDDVRCLIKHIDTVADELLKRGVNTVIYDTSDLEVIDNEIRVTSGAVFSKDEKLPEGGIVPNAIYCKYKRLSPWMMQMNQMFQARDTWNKFNKDYEKVIGTYKEIKAKLESEKIGMRNEKAAPVELGGKKRDIPSYENIYEAGNLHFERKGTPMIPPTQSSLLCYDKWEFYDALKRFIKEKSVKKHEEYDLYLPKCLLVGQDVRKIPNITGSSMDWLEKYPGEVETCLGLLKNRTGSAGQDIEFLRTREAVLKACMRGGLAGIFNLGHAEHFLQEYVPLIAREDSEIEELRKYAGRPYVLRILLDGTGEKPIVYAYVGGKGALTSHEGNELVLIKNYGDALENKIREFQAVLNRAYSWCLRRRDGAMRIGQPLTHVGVDAGIGYKKVRVRGKEKILKYLVILEANDAPSMEKEVLEKYKMRVVADFLKLV